jgi:hypothetical protein
VFSNSDPEEVIFNLIEFVDSVIDIGINHPAGLIASKIAFELVNPFGNHLTILGLVSEVTLPVLTSFSITDSEDDNFEIVPLTIAEDSLIFAAALTIINSNSPFPSLEVLQRLIPRIDPKIVHYRLSIHSQFALLKSWFSPNSSLSKWLSPIHSSQTKDVIDFPLDIFKQNEFQNGFIGIFTLFAELFPLIPIDAGPYFNRLPDGVRFATKLRSFEPTIFEKSQTAALLPRKELVDLVPFVGLGRWLSWIWRTGKSIPIPLSRVILRFALGGELRGDDFADADPEFGEKNPSEKEREEWIKPYRKQLLAIRAGAAASGLIVEDADIGPRVFQLRPFTVVGKVEPGLMPLVREAIWVRNVRFGKGEKEGREGIAQIVKEFESEG